MPISEFWLHYWRQIIFFTVPLSNIIFFSQNQSKEIFFEKIPSPPPQNIKWTVPKCDKRKSQMRYNANKGKKRERQMWNNANKGERHESQLRNNTHKSVKTQKWNVLLSYITLYVCTSNHGNQFHIVNCLHNLYDRIL